MLDTIMFETRLKKLKKELDKIVNDKIDCIEYKVKAKTPVDTGNLLNSWHRVDLKDKTVIYNTAPYAHVVEFGLYNGPTEKVTSEGYSRKAPNGMVRVSLIECLMK